MIRRPFGLFSLTVLVLAVAILVAGGLGWVTVSSLKVEEEQRLAESLAQRNEKERLALWRLDSRIYFSLGLEGYRKYEDYTALYSPPGEAPGCTSYLSRLVVADIPEWMRLHVQLDPTSGWTSPQVLPANTVAQLSSSNPELKLFNLTFENRQRLTEWSRRMPRDLAFAALKSSDSDLPDSSAIMVAGMDSNPEMKRQSTRDLKQVPGNTELLPNPAVPQSGSRGANSGRNSTTFNQTPYLGNTNLPSAQQNQGGQQNVATPQAGGRGGQVENPFNNDSMSRQNSNFQRLDEAHNGLGMSQPVVNPKSINPKAPEALAAKSVPEKEDLAKSEKAEGDKKLAASDQPPPGFAPDMKMATPQLTVPPPAIPAVPPTTEAKDKFAKNESSKGGAANGGPGGPGGIGGFGGGIGGGGGGMGKGMSGPGGFGGGGIGGIGGGINGGIGGGGLGGGAGIGGMRASGRETLERNIGTGAIAIGGGMGFTALKNVELNTRPKFSDTLTQSSPATKPAPGIASPAAGAAPPQPPMSMSRRAAPIAPNSALQKNKEDDASKHQDNNKTKAKAESTASSEERKQEEPQKKSSLGMVKNQPDVEGAILLPPATQKPAPSVPALPVDLGPMRPKWVTDVEGNNVLVVFRPARLESKVVYQGIWIDWEKLCKLLREEYIDDFPEGTLVPSLETVDAPQHQLASLPVRFEMGPIPAPPAVGWTPLRIGLSLAWLAAALSLIAVWFGGWSLVDLSERRIRFVSAVTHELRTPMTSLRLYLDMLTSGMIKDEEQKQQYLTTLSHESNRLHQLIENVLDFARLEKRGASLAAVPVSVSELCEPIRETWQERLAADGKELVIISTVPADQRVIVDPRIALQILGNLIDNARKYTPGAVDPRIWLWVKPAGRQIAFEVEDRGPGIPVTERRSIFRPFHRGGSSGATGGAGLGLALAKQWADTSGGRLTYRPADGGTGSCFRLELPT